jgi:uncharacterized membrane protein
MHTTESFLSEEQEKSVINAIKKAEKNTSGEIRVHIEEKTEKPTLERAKEVFFSLKMNQTKNHNGVLLYIGVADKQFAILGDTGIDKVVPDDFWDAINDLIIKHFSNNQFEKGLTAGIQLIGKKLKEFFPYKNDDKNELSDEISKG